MKTQYETPEMIVYHFAADKEIMANPPDGSGSDPFNLDSLLDEETFFGE